MAWMTPTWTVDDLAAALRQLHRGQRVWSYPVEGEEAEARWLVEWLTVHRAAPPSKKVGAP